MMVALGVVLMVLGAVVDVLDLTACAISSLVVVFVYLEIGSPYTWLVWLCTSLLSFVFFPGKALWVEYLLIFGIYPILKAYIERLPRKLWLIIKLLYSNGIILLLMLLVKLIFKTPLVESELPWMLPAIYVLMNVAFVAYDMFITVMVRFYFVKLRNRIKHLLK